MLTKRYSDRSELAAGGAKTREVFAGDQRRACAWRGHAKDRVFAVSAAGFSGTLGISCPAHHRLAETREAHRGEASDRVGQAGVDCHRGPLEATSSEASMRPGLVVQSELEPEGVGQRISIGTDRRAEADD